MRAVEFSEYGPPGVLRIAEVDEPRPGPGTIRIAVRASGVATGEVLIRSGGLPAAIPAVFPWRTGFAAAGVVDELGADVTGVRPGDEVFGWTSTATRGANADRTVLTAWAPKPAGWSWAEAGGAAGSVETATRVLDRLRVAPGQTLLIQGAAGGVGAVAVQMAVARGATVIGTASDHNHEFLRSFGARPTTYGPGLVDRVRELAPGGVDGVFDCAGGALPDLITLAGDPARVVTIADFTAGAYGVHLSHGAPTRDAGTAAVPGADPMAVHALGLAVRLADEGRLRVPVAAAFPLTEVAAAHELSESRHARGLIVLMH